MSSSQNVHALPGSEPVRTHSAVQNAQSYDDDEVVSVSFRTSRDDQNDIDLALSEIFEQSPDQRHHLSPTEVKMQFKARDESLAIVADVMSRFDLEIGNADPVAGSIEVSGSFKKLCEVFQVRPLVHQGPHGLVRSHRGPIHLPAELTDVVEAVLGLDDHPVAWPHHAVNAETQHHPICALDVAELYDFPPGDGAEQKVAIIELGGGFHQQDLEAYCTLTGISKPQVQVREIGGETNEPADNASIAAALEAYGLTTRHRSQDRSAEETNGESSIKDVLWTIETSLDLELVAALAPRAEINVYFAPNNSRGKVQALQAALDDGCSVVSISFGARERGINTGYVEQMELLLKRAALQGATVLCASGDGGYLEYPASSPFATACGGTNLHDKNGKPVQESVWNEAVPVPEARLMLSSGGVSSLFELPKWQENVDVVTKTGLSMRGVPDVAAKADLSSGYRIIAGGVTFATGGTSAAAPLWAGLTARLNQHLMNEHGTTLGHLPSLLYRNEWSQALTDICSGRSGAYRACRGWDPCTGLGSPNGKKLLDFVMRKQ